MKKTLLIIGAGPESIPGYQKAKDLGLFIVATDKDINAPGRALADDFIKASTYDIELTISKVKKYHFNNRKIDGVICIANDVPLSVAKVAEVLNLPGISIESATWSSDKVAMKKRFSETNIPIPWFTEINSLKDLIVNLQDKKINMVLKPVDSRGSRGVIRINKSSNLEWAYNYSKDYSLCGKNILEEYLEGPQISSESIVVNGIAHTIGLSDRNYDYLDEYFPHFIENGGDLPPGCLDDELKEKICNLIQKVAVALKIKNGIIKGDLVLRNKELLVIEIAARLSGGYFSSHQIPLNNGIDLVTLAIRQCLGEEISNSDIEPKYERFISDRWWIPSPGKVKEITNYEKYKNDARIKLLEIRVKPGDLIGEVTSHSSRGGVVIVEEETREKAIFLADKIVRDIKIIVE